MNELKLPERLSYSSVKSYKTCGEQWRLQRGLELPDMPGWYHAGGTAVHNDIEDENVYTLGGAKPSLTFNEYFDEAIAEQEESTGTTRDQWKIAGKGKEDEAWWRLNGPAMVNRWKNFLKSSPFSVWVTPHGEPALELEVNPTFGSVDSKGFIDCVLVRDDNPDVLVVVDYKTGKPPDDQLQLAGYAQALTDKGWPCYTGGYFMARGGILTSYGDLTALMGPRLVYEYEQAWTGIQNQVFPAHPSGLCKDWCSVNKYCAWGGKLSDTTYLPFPTTKED